MNIFGYRSVLKIPEGVFGRGDGKFFGSNIIHGVERQRRALYQPGASPQEPIRFSKEGLKARIIEMFFPLGSLKEFVGRFLMSFSHWGQNTIALFVIPAKAGTQIRDVPVDRVSLGFCPCFPVRATLGPRVRGDDELGRESGNLGRGSGKGHNIKPGPEMRSGLRAS